MLPEVVLGFAIALPAAGAVLFLSRRLGLLDRPGAIKPHLRPVPYTGGAAIALSMLVAGPIVSVPIPVIAGGLLAWLVGFVDDFKQLEPRLKLLATLPALVLGSFSIELAPAERLAAVAVGAVLVNAFNVIDGLDALAGGTALIGLIALLVIGVPFSSAAAVSLGAVLAFLLFNLPPAMLFLGDEGSLLLGYVLWLLPVAAVAEASSARLIAASALLWAFPIVNAAFVILARVRAGRPLLAGDRSHLYDELNRRVGLRGTLIVCWTIAAAGALFAAGLA